MSVPDLSYLKHLHSSTFALLDPDHSTRDYTVHSEQIRLFAAYNAALQSNQGVQPFRTPLGYDLFASFFNRDGDCKGKLAFKNAEGKTVTPGPSISLKAIVGKDLAEAEIHLDHGDHMLDERQRSIFVDMLMADKERSMRGERAKRKSIGERMRRKEEMGRYQGNGSPRDRDTSEDFPPPFKRPRPATQARAGVDSGTSSYKKAKRNHQYDDDYGRASDVGVYSPGPEALMTVDSSLPGSTSTALTETSTSDNDLFPFFDNLIGAAELGHSPVDSCAAADGTE
ncbi:hypothetical protein SERLA73DRAFT_155505 [Serpula lacrymans var. lacrymans S7.3]|uniref:Uncharacterized protein n=1 Tax=Serpula lacrymans var. lacrymans (strain S7.3) TaxID=936435 RepID=F8QAH8_SERL3|nr:hypothetical protein SERLA73DRAFT_155505 [Serpula lacrymans var. lacrymans S7.3]